MSRRRTQQKPPGFGQSKHRKARIQRFSTKHADSPKAWLGKGKKK